MSLYHTIKGLCEIILKDLNRSCQVPTRKQTYSLINVTKSEVTAGIISKVVCLDKTFLQLEKFAFEINVSPSFTLPVFVPASETEKFCTSSKAWQNRSALWEELKAFFTL